jgi:N-carbamoyl-L-amino-acid hydrolase
MAKKAGFCLLLIALVFEPIEMRGFADFPDIPQKELRVNGKRLAQRISELARFGLTPEGGVNRVAFSEEDVQAREYLKGVFQEAGLVVSVDAAGNLLGRRAGQEDTLPPIMFGSHIDTVPHGGKYDGALGVLAALECAQVLAENCIQTRHPLEVIVFTDEEGGLAGSRSLVGDLTPDALSVISHSGKTIRAGILTLGGDPDRLLEMARRRGEVRAFLEIHVEQGGILEGKKIDIGIVQGIVGINWWEVKIEGAANHAGTTPMDMRQDALLAAAHLILSVNGVVRRESGRQVGTVGRIQAEPGAPNVIPGKVVMSLELRDLSAEKIQRLFQQIQTEAKGIERNTGTRIFFSAVDAMAKPALTDPPIQDLLEESARDLGLSSLRLPSGAGHDAQEMARIAPIGMIFVPSVGGISHSAREYTRNQDMENGANVLLQAILKIDALPLINR